MNAYAYYIGIDNAETAMNLKTYNIVPIDIVNSEMWKLYSKSVLDGDSFFVWKTVNRILFRIAHRLKRLKKQIAYSDHLEQINLEYGYVTDKSEFRSILEVNKNELRAVYNTYAAIRADLKEKHNIRNLYLRGTNLESIGVQAEEYFLGGSIH